MSIVQTVLIFAVVPGAIVAAFALAVFGASSARQQVRYRPGRPWQFAPVWYVPHPEVEQPTTPESERAALLGSSQADPKQISGTTAPAPVPAGGASGEW